MSIADVIDRVDVPLLSADDERALATAIGAGRAALEDLARGEGPERDLADRVRAGEAARERFVLANVRLAALHARRFPARHGLTHDDYFAAAVEGLMRAAAKFDPSKGFRFSTYASIWCRQSIARAIDHASPWPVHVSSDLRTELAAAHGDEQQLSESDRRLLELDAPVSLEQPTLDGDSTLLASLPLPDPAPDDLAITSHLAASALASITDLRARRMVELRMGLVDGDPWSYRRIGDQYGCTGESARHHVRDALAQAARAIGAP